jgi:hypothetical protein
MLHRIQHDGLTRPLAFPRTFLTFVSEMGRQNEKIAHGFDERRGNQWCDAGNRFDHKALSSVCLLLVLRWFRRSHA